MNKKAQVGLDIVKTTLLVLLILGVLGVVVILVFSVLNPVVTSLDTTRTSNLIENLSTETHSVNLTGYTFPICNSFTGGRIDTLVITNSSGTSINSGNATITGCTVTNATGTYGAQTWNMTATYSYLTSGNNANNIGNNITSGVVTFFTYIPTIMAILAVVVIIAAVAILIFYVKGFEGRKEGGI